MSPPFARFLPRSARALFCALFLAYLAALVGCSSGTDGETAGDAAAADGASDGGSAPAQPAPKTAKGLLEAMAKAYQEAKSYEDGGLVRVKYTIDGETIEDEFPLSVAYQSPNRLRLHAYGGIICCDGETLYASHDEISGYVVTAEPPLKLTHDDVFHDDFMREKLTTQLCEPLQLYLLLDADLVPRMIQQVGEENLRLLEDAELDRETLRRVELSRDGMSMVFWISPESYALRRVEYPSEQTKQNLEENYGAEVTDVSVIADFPGVKLNSELEPVAFQFQMPEEAEEVLRFVPPPPEILGKPLEGYAFTLPDGGKLTPEDLKDKIVVLDFWATWCQPCLQNMPNLARVVEKYKDNDKLQIVAVSVDQPEVTWEQINATISALKVDVPLARASPDDIRNIFGGPFPIPNVLIIGPDGTVQDQEVGIDPEVAVDPQLPARILIAKIEDMLSGKSLYEQRLAEFKQAMMELPTAVEAPPVVIAEPSQPQHFKLNKLWTCSDLVLPGNVYVVPQPEGSPRIVVHDGWQSLAEVGLDGKLIARHPLPLEDEAIAFTRTAVDGQGNRYYACLAINQKRVHVLDADWDLKFSYPQEENLRTWDAQLADLDGDGALELVVSLMDVAGVHGVSLEGERQWAERSITDVFTMTPTAPDGDGRRQLLCTSTQGNLAVLNHDGSRGEDIDTQRSIRLLAGADLDGTRQYVALGFTPQRTDVLVSVGLDGSELWSYPMPVAQQHPALEPIGSGRLLGDADHWVVVGPDGSVHLIAADGTPLDRFNYGAIISGFAVTEIDGGPVLLIASEKNGLEAWAVE